MAPWTIARFVLHKSMVDRINRHPTDLILVVGSGLNSWGGLRQSAGGAAEAPLRQGLTMSALEHGGVGGRAFGGDDGPGHGEVGSELVVKRYGWRSLAPLVAIGRG
jgi:hypothetical protein